MCARLVTTILIIASVTLVCVSGYDTGVGEDTAGGHGIRLAAASPTTSETRTTSRTASETKTSSKTPTISHTPTKTGTISLTGSITRSISFTRSISYSSSVTKTSSSTYSQSKTSSISRSGSHSPSHVNTLTPSISDSVTPSLTPSFGASITPSSSTSSSGSTSGSLSVLASGSSTTSDSPSIALQPSASEEPSNSSDISCIACDCNNLQCCNATELQDMSCSQATTRVWTPLNIAAVTVPTVCVGIGLAIVCCIASAQWRRRRAIQPQKGGGKRLVSREGHSDSDSVIIADGDVNVLKRKRSSSSSSYGKRDSGALESPQPGVFELQVCCLKFRWLTGPSSKRNVTSELSPMASLPAVIVDTQVDDESADVTGPPSTFPAVRKRRVLKSALRRKPLIRNIDAMDGSGGGSVDSVPVSLPDVEASSQPHSLRGLVPTHFYDTSEAVTVFPSQQLAEEFGTAVPGRVSAPSANQFPIDLSKHQMPLPADALFPGISFSGLKSLHKAASLSSRPPSLHTLEPADQTMSSPKQLRRIRLSRRVKSSLDASLVNSSRTLRKWRKKRLARFATSPTRRPPFASAADTSSALSAEIIREEAVKDTLDRVAHDLAVAKTAIRVYKKKLKRRSSNVSHPL